MGLELIQCTKNDPILRANMAIHYSQPKGFVGRSICYTVKYDGEVYGNIVGGSATKHLPGRYDKLCLSPKELNNIVNNIFFHVEPVNGKYPVREFLPKILSMYRTLIETDWKNKYGDTVLGHETLVELPRTGECYKRDGWVSVGQTKGFTCKRVGGESMDSWSGRRVWNTDPSNLKPKLVFVRNI